MSDDLIRRQDAIEAIRKDIMGGLNYESILKSLPAIEAEPVRHGRWESVTEDWRNQITWWNCSECDCEVSTKYDYCPNCGAKMDGLEEGENNED